MLTYFNISQQGASHISQSKECQDYSFVCRKYTDKERREYIIAGIADGVGSAEFSRVGAKTAVLSAIKCIRDGISETIEYGIDDGFLDLLRRSFQCALTCVEEKAEACSLPLILLDSTLTVSIYDGTSLWFGHRGDDGIVVMLEDGSYKMATQRHKDQDAIYVKPLRDTKGWEFDKVEHVASFVMMTDGMLDYCVDKAVMNNRVYLPFLYPLLYKAIQTDEEMQAYRQEWVRYLWGNDGKKPESCSKINDSEPNRTESINHAILSETDHLLEARNTERIDSNSMEEEPRSAYVPRVRDDVYDDLTVVLVENPDSVTRLPSFSFDYQLWETESRLRAQSRDEGLRRAAANRMKEQQIEQEKRQVSRQVRYDKTSIYDDKMSFEHTRSDEYSVSRHNHCIDANKNKGTYSKQQARSPMVNRANATERQSGLSDTDNERVPKTKVRIQVEEGNYYHNPQKKVCYLKLLWNEVIEWLDEWLEQIVRDDYE